MLWRISIEKLQMTLKEFLLEGLKTFLNMRAERESDAAKWRETFPPAEVTPLAPSATALEAAERESRLQQRRDIVLPRRRRPKVLARPQERGSGGAGRGGRRRWRHTGTPPRAAAPPSGSINRGG